MSEEFIKPCPFCGWDIATPTAGIEDESEYILIDEERHFRRYYLCCWSCNCCAPLENSREEAIAAWNKRHHMNEGDRDAMVKLREMYERESAAAEQLRDRVDSYAAALEALLGVDVIKLMCVVEQAQELIETAKAPKSST